MTRQRSARRQRVLDGENCQLGWLRAVNSDCPDPAVTTIASIRMCETHLRRVRKIAKAAGIDMPHVRRVRA